MTKRIAIIGAGVGGLSAGCYARMNGYDTRIFEMHSVPGGVCTSWRRKGYTFDGCIHHLAGCSPETRYYRIWEELGALPTRHILYPGELVRAEEPGGKSLTISTDIDRLEEEMLELAPEDSGVIREYVDGARRFTEFDMLELFVMTRRELIGSVARLPGLFKYMKPTMESYARRFSDPFIRRVFPMLMYDTPNNPLATQLNILGGLRTGRYGWPAGGSLEFARAIERRYVDLGGEISYRSKVSRIIVKGGRAAGVSLDDGSEYPADVVISNAYGRATIYDMLGGLYTSGKIDAFYSRPVDEVGMGVHVSLGVDMDLSSDAHAIVLMLEEPVVIADRERDHLDLEIFCFDRSMAPQGKSVLKVLLNSSYSYWKELHGDAERYREVKQGVADTVIALLERRFAGFKSRVEVVDVATPMTTERYTGIATPFKADASQFFAGVVTGKWLSETLPGLDDFYMVGQWAGPPGVSSVAGMGRDLVRKLCKRDRRGFVTSTP